MRAFGNWNRLGAATAALAVMMAAAACSDSRSMVSPTAATPANLAGTDGVNGGDVNYKATIAPTTATAAASTNFTVEIINCTEVLCGGGLASGANQVLGYTQIQVPAGFGAPTGLAVTASGGKDWEVSFAAGVISAVAEAGNQRIAVGEKVTITFTSTAPSTCASYTWNTTAWKNINDNEFNQIGLEPEVAVEGCGTTATCTYGQGYWKNHEEAWPVAGLTLGTVEYTKAELLSILNQSANPGNGLIILAYQLIAAKLNVANGVDGSSVAAAIAAADALIGALVVPPVGTDSLLSSAVGTVKDTLENFNKGVTGPGACIDN